MGIKAPENQSERDVEQWYGKDEMNLADFPIATLRLRGDTRKRIEHIGEFTDSSGIRHQQTWIVTGDSELGLPNEFDERVYVALMAITAREEFQSRRVPFSIYKILRILGQPSSGNRYEYVERALDRLTSVTIRAKGSFFDNASGETVRTAMTFGVLDKYWLRYREKDSEVLERETDRAYIVWGEDIWNSFQSGYIKNLDLGFFYGLDSPTARRLYRLLDKRMRHRDEDSIDIFRLASRLGMRRYEYPSQVLRKLDPGLQELVDKGFLISYGSKKYRGYTRLVLHRSKRGTVLPLPPSSPNGAGDSEIITQLERTGIGAKNAERLSKEFPSGYLSEKIEFLKWKTDPKVRHRGRPIKDPAAWLIRAIEQDFVPPAAFKNRARKEKEREERAALLEATESQIQGRQTSQTKERDSYVATLREKHGTTEAESALWEQVLENIQSRIAPATFKLYLGQTELLSVGEETVVVGVPNTIVRDWIRGRGESVLVEAIEQVVGSQKTVSYVVMKPETTPDQE